MLWFMNVPQKVLNPFEGRLVPYASYNVNNLLYVYVLM